MCGKMRERRELTTSCAAQQIVERAADEGISEVRLSANTFDCIFGDVADLGFKEVPPHSLVCVLPPSP
jgi:hypothetical protein